ncbi:MAG: DNA polymerase III subunit alpha, partial [Treponema sp.]|nr:DNA polymerase III subunit alpha [Treponema sp.]
DVNRSDSIFDVVDGRIVFGLMGIKGLGQGAAEAIVKERTENGPYKSFIDFLDRLDIHEVNKKAIEVLIKTGGFDHLDKNRATLLLNYERAIEYEEKKKSGSENGQASLFEEAGIQEFVDFKYEDCEEMPKMEALNMEKELIGCFVSGHPLDDWRSVIEKCVTLDSSNFAVAAQEDKSFKDSQIASGQSMWKLRDSGRPYVAIGLIQGLREIMTKKGQQMAFAKLQDFKGEIDVTFFPDNWAKFKPIIKNEEVFALRGRVDGSRDNPSFIVDKIEDPHELEEKSITSIHIQLDNGFSFVRDINPLRDFLFGAQGNCLVYFHIEVDGSSFVIKANTQMTVGSDQETVQTIKDLPLVKDVWCE